MYCPKCGNEIKGNQNFCPSCGAKLSKAGILKGEAFSHDLTAVWPEWEIEKRLGKGSYGTVYQVVRNDNNIETRAAIKVISIPSDPSEIDSLRSEGMDISGTRNYFKGIVDDFIDEIRLMESLKGAPNIVAVEDYKVVEKTGEIGWDIYIRMELLTPFDRYAECNTLTEKEIVKLGHDICSALEICSKRNIIHRDIKPENIFIDDYGYFKLGDFGIARELGNSVGGLSQKGTMNYIAPEVASCAEYDLRADIYSLGIVLYRFANSNRLPFVVSNNNEATVSERKYALDRRIRGEKLMPPDKASKALSDVILRACAYDPEARYASAAEMKKALMAVSVEAVSEFDRTTVVRKAEIDYVGMATVPKTLNEKNTDNVNHFGNSFKKSFDNKWRKTAVCCISAIVVLLAVLAVLFFTSGAFRVFSGMRSEDYDEALKKYHSDVKGSFVQEKLLDLLLKNRVDKIAKDVEKGKMDYDVAIKELSALDEMKFDDAWEECDIIMSEYADSIVSDYENGKLDYDSAVESLNELKSEGLDNVDSYINRIRNSTVNAFEKANECYEEGNYREAISEYSRIPETDVRYEEAQLKLAQTYKDYLTSVAETANDLSIQGSYKEAVIEIDTAYDIVPDDVDTAETDAIRAKCLDAYKATVEHEVDTLIEQNSYAEAFDLINEAIGFDNNEFFVSLKNYTEGKYVAYITQDVKDAVGRKENDKAKTLIENALVILPGNASLLQLKIDLENGKLEELSPLEYFIMNSDKMYFTKADFASFDANMCRIARNGIYARLGRKFNDSGLTNYFSQFDWYKPTIEPDRFSESLLNKYQMANRDLISEYEREKGYQ